MTAQDKSPRLPTWHFQQLPHCGTIVCVEPDGTEHVVSSGDMNSTHGHRLLNAMVRDLCEPIALQDPQPSRECLQQSAALHLADACAGDWEAVRPHLVVQMLRDQHARIAELEALQAAPPAPEGFALVPVQPTSKQVVLMAGAILQQEKGTSDTRHPYWSRAVEQAEEAYSAAIEHAPPAQAPAASPVLFVSPGQLEKHSDPDGPDSTEAGRYLPARKTPAGKFTQPLYVQAHDAPAAVAVPSLADRVRPGVEAAPWVCDAIMKMETELARLRAALAATPARICNTCQNTGIVKGLHDWSTGGTRQQKCWNCHAAPAQDVQQEGGKA